MKKEFIFWTIAILMLAIVCTSAQGYTIDGDTVFIQRTHADITAYPHTISNPWEWQNFKLDVKTSGDMCVAYKTPEKLYGSQIEQLTQTGYKDRKSYFNTLEHSGSYYYYTEDSFSVTAGNEYEWRIRYGHKDSDWKTNIILWNSVSGDCKQDYIDGPQVLYDLDPWAVSTDFRSCKNISIKGPPSAIGWFPLYVKSVDTTDLTRNDIRMVDGGCDVAGDLLPFEVDYIATNDLNLWIGKNLTSTDDFTISMYYNNSVLDVNGEDADTVWQGHVGVYHKSENTGSTVADSTSYSNDGTAQDSTSWVAGKIGRSLDYDGTSDYVTITDDDSLSFNGGTDKPFTFSAWVNMDDATKFRMITKSNMEYGIFTSNVDRWQINTYSTSTANKIGVANNVGQTAFEGTWTHIAYTYDGSESSNGFDIFRDSNDLSTTANTGGSYSGMVNTLGNLYLGTYHTASPVDYADGQIDEVRIYQSVKSQDYLEYEYWTIQNQSQYVTVYPDVFNPLGVSTSMQVLDVSPVDDFLFSSSVFTPASVTTFNLTTPRDATFTGSMNIVKLTNPPSTSQISIRIELDDVMIHQEVLRTAEGVNNIGSTGITPFVQSIGSGQHNITILYAASGAPQINISNQKIGALIGESSLGNEIDIEVRDANFSISSSSISPVYSWNITKTVDNTDTFILTKQTLDSSANNIALMYINDTEDTDISPYWSRWTGSTFIGSTLGLWIDINESSTHEHDIMGSVSSGTVDITSTILDFDLADNGLNVISNSRQSNSSTDLDNDILLSTGSHIIINQSHTVQAGGGVLVSAQISAESNQNGNTPTFTLSSDLGDDYSVKRTFSTQNQPGNVIMFHPVNCSIGDTINVSLIIDIPAAKSLDLLDEELTIFDIDFVAGEIGNIPPVFITQPEDDILYINLTSTDTYLSSGDWFDINDDDTSISSNCTFLSVSVNNVTETYNVSWTATYPSDIGSFYCDLTLTDINGGTSTSDTFNINVLNSTYEQLTVSTPPDFVLNVNATLNDSIAYEGIWFSGQNRSADVSSDCSYLDIITFNTTKTYWLNWTAVYPGDIMADSCQLSIQSSLLSNTSGVFTIDVNNATYTPGVDPGPTPEVNVTGRLEYIGCTSDTTPDAILLIGILFLVGIISISFYWINRAVQLPIMSGFSIMYGGLLCFIAWNFATCFFLSVWMIVLLGIGNIIDGFVTMVSD